MTHTKFSLDGSAFGACTRSMIHPCHIKEIEVQHGDAVVNFPRNIQPTPVTAAAVAQETPELLLNSVLEDASDLQTYRDNLRYHYVRYSGPDWDVPEADDETMEENSVEEDQSSLQVTFEAMVFECTYFKAGREASPIHMDVEVVQQTVSTSAEEGSESAICSSRILMEVHVDLAAESDSCERLSQAMKGEASSVDMKLISESHTKALHDINPDEPLIKCSLTSTEPELPEG